MSPVEILFSPVGTHEVYHFLENEKGEQNFIISEFSPLGIKKNIRGSITLIDNEAISELLSKWTLHVMPSKRETISEYRNLVLKAKQEVSSGHYQKLVPACNKIIPKKVNLGDLFNKLLSRYKDAFVYILNMDARVMCGASPEFLLKRHDDKLHAEALGGTETEHGFAEKEYKEHESICTYLEGVFRNKSYDFHRKNGRIKKAGPVQHLATPFELIPKNNFQDLNLVEHLHPTPAICGLPKDESLNFIEKNEGFNRGFYAGYLGPVYSGQRFEIMVNLRCAEVYLDYVELFAGAGVNEMSDPDLEFQEVCMKMSTIESCLD